MSKIFLTVILFTAFTYTSLNAAVYKGQREYIKKCRECHKNGQKIAAGYKKREWKELFDKKGAGLAKLHLDSKDAEKSWKYFKSKKYAKKTKHLKDFMMEYAKDSGNVPACD
ncbi:MAG: cytochrome C [Campylobacterota bacterium]|nr:cytochrome C [Campylobacterota bacterium]